MTRWRSWHFAALGTLLSLVAAVASGQVRQTTIGVDEITPGMRGYGMTVFRGTVPERFDVEVVDVLRQFRPDQDLILIRCNHPILDHANTVGGMSGSPVYLDGRLAGAYAYGWPFGKDPIAGVTPIANMLREMRRPTRPTSFPGAHPLGAPPVPRAPRADASSWLGGLPAWTTEDRGALAGLELLAHRGVPELRPAGYELERAATPLMLGGFADAAADALSAQLGRFGLEPVQAGGAGASPGAPDARFVDGGAIAVQLVRGDLAVTAVGTVTHVDGSKVIAFGHPMMNAGEVGLPTATARVLHILASEQRSFKIAEAQTPLGTLVHDRQAAIVIDTQLVAATVPVTLHVSGVDGAPRDTWHLEIVAHRVLTPALLLAAIGNAIEATASDQTRLTYTADARVDVEGHGRVSVRDVGYLGGGIADEQALARLRVFDVVSVALGNAFEEGRVTNIELDLALRFARETSEIVDALVSSDEVDPGATVNVTVLLRRFGERPRTRVVAVRVPESAAGTELELLIQPGDDVQLEQPEPSGVEDLLRIVTGGWSSTELVVSARLPSRGLRFRGQLVRALPPSALDVLQLSNESAGALPFTTQSRTVTAIGDVLTGSARVRLRVRAVPRD